MTQKKPKLPNKDGVQSAVDAVKKFRKQQPSERLIKIISETPESDTGKIKPGIAAQDAEI